MAFDLNKGDKKLDLPSAKTADAKRAGWLFPVVGVVAVAAAGWYFFGRSQPEAVGTSSGTATPPVVTTAAGQVAAPTPTKDVGVAAPLTSTPPTTQPQAATTPAPAGAATADKPVPGVNPTAPAGSGAAEKPPTSPAATPAASTGGRKSPAAATEAKPSSGAPAQPGGSAATARPSATPEASASAKGNGKAGTSTSIIPARFDALSSSINAPDDAVVAKILAYLSEHPATKVTVNGYASSDGDLAMNIELSAKRAEAFKAYLVGKGVPAERILAVGKGIENPIASNETQPGRAQNRRVEVVY